MKDTLSRLICSFFRCDQKDNPMPPHYIKKLQSILREAMHSQKNEEI